MTTCAQSATFTPFFDWVARATGDSSTTLAYGVIWRYAQMGAEKRSARCYASCERLAAELTWTRQRLMRHLRHLLGAGLIRCLNPGAVGVPREYVPVAYEEWAAAEAPAIKAPATLVAPGTCDKMPDTCNTAYGVSAQPSVAPYDTPRAISSHPPVAPRDAPCATPLRSPVTACDTNKTLEDTKDTKERPERETTRVRNGPTPAPKRPAVTAAGAAPRAPGLHLVKNIMGKMPPKATHERVVRALGPAPNVERLRTCYEEWCARGYNPRNLAWLLEWYAGGAIPPNKPPGRGRRATHDDDASSPESFAIWGEYQAALQRGEDPAGARRRLGL
jgi:hypothetical protein